MSEQVTVTIQKGELFFYRVGDRRVPVLSARTQVLELRGKAGEMFIWIQQEGGHRFRAPITQLQPVSGVRS